jgi:hypothetical protein
MAVVLHLEGEHSGQSASTVDFSQHGLQIQTVAKLEPGKLVEVHLGDGSEGVISARVAWVGKVDTGQAERAGLKFLNPRTSKNLADD